MSKYWDEQQKRWDARRKRTTEFLASIGQEYPYCGFDVGAGWEPIVNEALQKMAKVDIPWRLAQVKQKFCQLRIYVDFAKAEAPPWIWQPENPQHDKYKEIQQLIGEAEGRCDVACENCGTEVPGGPASGQKLCDPCREEERKRYDE